MESVLSGTERARADRFLQPRDRRRYIIARGCLRRLIGEYLAASPAEIALSASEFGKPYLSDPSFDLRFNVAHSGELALFAFARGRDVGVDLEAERPDVDWHELSPRYLAPNEVAAISAEPTDSARQTAFFRCWTRKEAYVKALGLGMQIPLDGFAVTILADRAALLHTAHDPGQHRRWELRDLPAAQGFAAALAVEGRDWRLWCARHAGFP
jgi:4'-phosphopantetheinyl transferase